jgi:hypothetical protein
MPLSASNMSHLLLFSFPDSYSVIPDRSLTGSKIQGNALKPSNAVIARLDRAISAVLPNRDSPISADASSWNDNSQKSHTKPQSHSVTKKKASRKAAKNAKIYNLNKANQFGCFD